MIAIKEIVDQIGIYKFVEFFQRLKHLGEKCRHLLRCSHRTDDEIIQTTNTKQFVIASVVSIDELKREDYTIIDMTVFDLIVNYDSETFPSCATVYQHGGIAVILNNNMETLNMHGECTLLDPDGKIQKDLQDWDQASPKSGVDYVQAIKGFSVQPDLLLIYSYYIPCNISPHDCAYIVGEYAKRTETKVVIGYDHVHEQCGEEESFRAMMNHNCYVIYLGDEEFKRPDKGTEALDYIDDLVYLMSQKALPKRMTKRRKLRL